MGVCEESGDVELIRLGTFHQPSSCSMNRKARIALIVVGSVLGLGIALAFLCLLDAKLSAVSEKHIAMMQQQNAVQQMQVGAVATSHHLATKAAMETLEAGGNAADAAAVIQFMLNVVQPMSTGIGGGCFIMHYDKQSGEISAIDGREEAPDAFHPNIFCGEPECMLGPCNCTQPPVSFDVRDLGGNSVGVPGVIAAVQRLLDEHGTMTLAQVLQPAINHARHGFPMYHDMIDRISKNIDRLATYPQTAELFLNREKNGPRKLEGELWTNPDLANTLEELAIKGPDWFYRGDLADEIVSAVRNGVCNATGKYGVMVKSDLEGYRAVRRQPTNSTYREKTLYGMAMPSSGGTTVMAGLNILEAFDLHHLPWLSVEATHRMIDAQNIAYSDRDKYAADADFVDVPQIGMVNKGYGNDRRNALVAPFHVAWTPVVAGVPPGTSPVATRHATEPVNNRHGTTHLSVADRWGNVVSMTTTIEANFGSALVVPGRGFLLNNELTDFADKELDSQGHLYANRPEGGKRLRRTALGADANTLGGKRPRSSMSPTIVFDENGKFMLAAGAAGGSTIIGTVFGIISGVVDFNDSVAAAVAASRIHARNGPAYVEADHLNDPYLFSTLTARGAVLMPSEGTRTHPQMSYTVAQAIMVSPNGTWSAASDPRFTASRAEVL